MSSQCFKSTLLNGETAAEIKDYTRFFFRAPVGKVEQRRVTEG
jgi:hypothetical protein